jgi:hypothetical protein
MVKESEKTIILFNEHMTDMTGRFIRPVFAAMHPVKRSGRPFHLVM